MYLETQNISLIAKGEERFELVALRWYLVWWNYSVLHCKDIIIPVFYQNI